MLILGIVLIVLALLVPALKVLFAIGAVLVLVGLLLLALHSTRGGRNWY